MPSLRRRQVEVFFKTEHTLHATRSTHISTQGDTRVEWASERVSTERETKCGMQVARWEDLWGLGTTCTHTHTHTHTHTTVWSGRLKAIMAPSFPMMLRLHTYDLLIQTEIYPAPSLFRRDTETKSPHNPTDTFTSLWRHATRSTPCVFTATLLSLIIQTCVWLTHERYIDRSSRSL